MTKREQVAFVRSLAASVTGGIIRMIRGGHTTLDWDGHELRELLAVRFEQERGSLLRMPRSPRARAFKKTLARVPRT